MAQRNAEYAQFLLAPMLADVLATLAPMLRRRRVVGRLGAVPELACDTYPGSWVQEITNLVVIACGHAARGAAESL